LAEAEGKRFAGRVEVARFSRVLREVVEFRLGSLHILVLRYAQALNGTGTEVAAAIKALAVDLLTGPRTAVP